MCLTNLGEEQNKNQGWIGSMYFEKKKGLVRDEKKRLNV